MKILKGRFPKQPQFSQLALYAFPEGKFCLLLTAGLHPYGYPWLWSDSADVLSFCKLLHHMESMLPGYPSGDPVTVFKLGRAQLSFLLKPSSHTRTCLRSSRQHSPSCVFSMYPTVLSLFCDSSLDSKISSHLP